MRLAHVVPYGMFIQKGLMMRMEDNYKNDEDKADDA